MMTTSSGLGTCSTSSSETVPCPAMTRGSSEGCTNAAPGVSEMTLSAVAALADGSQRVTLLAWSELGVSEARL